MTASSFLLAPSAPRPFFPPALAAILLRGQIAFSVCVWVLFISCFAGEYRRADRGERNERTGKNAHANRAPRAITNRARFRMHIRIRCRTCIARFNRGKDYLSLCKEGCPSPLGSLFLLLVPSAVPGVSSCVAAGKNKRCIIANQRQNHRS